MIGADDAAPLAAPGQNIRGADGADRLVGGPNDDIIIGFEGNDTLEGGDGDDQPRGDQGDSRLIGGRGGDSYDLFNSGVNTIVINLGDSPVSAALRDAVSDWSSDDRLEFGVSPGAYAEVAVTTREAGLVQANNFIAAGARGRRPGDRLQPRAGRPGATGSGDPVHGQRGRGRHRHQHDRRRADDPGGGAGLDLRRLRLGGYP